MSTFELPILGSATRPDASGEVYQLPYSTEDAGAVFDPLLFMLNDSGAKNGLTGAFQVPQNYAGTARVNAYWNANAVAGSAVLDLSYLTRAVGDDMGAAATDDTDTVTTVTNAAAFSLNRSVLTLTAANFAAGDAVLFDFFRDGLSAADTLAAKLVLWGLTFEFSDV